MSFFCSVNKNQQGFTLLEIMLVLLLMGMISVSVVMTLPNHSSTDENIHWQAQRFNTLLQFAQDEALMSGLELAIEFKENSYQFAFYDQDSKKWLAAQTQQLQTLVELPSVISFEYELLGSVWDEIETDDQDDFVDESYLVDIEGDDKIKSLTPQVYIMSSGEITPFSVTFSMNEEQSKIEPVTLSVNMSGAVTRSGKENGE